MRLDKSWLFNELNESPQPVIEEDYSRPNKTLSALYKSSIDLGKVLVFHKQS